MQSRRYTPPMLSTIPASNVVTVQVRAKRFSLSDAIAARLLEALPGMFWKPIEVRSGVVTPSGRSPCKGHFVHVVRADSSKPERMFVKVWVTESETEIARGAEKMQGQVARYLGKCPWGQAYTSVGSDVRGLWPQHEEKM